MFFWLLYWWLWFGGWFRSLWMDKWYVWMIYGFSNENGRICCFPSALRTHFTSLIWSDKFELFKLHWHIYQQSTETFLMFFNFFNQSALVLTLCCSLYYDYRICMKWNRSFVCTLIWFGSVVAFLIVGSSFQYWIWILSRIPNYYSGIIFALLILQPELWIEGNLNKQKISEKYNVTLSLLQRDSLLNHFLVK